MDVVMTVDHAHRLLRSGDREAFRTFVRKLPMVPDVMMLCSLVLAHWYFDITVGIWIELGR